MQKVNKALAKMEQPEKRVHRGAVSEGIEILFPNGSDGYIITLGGNYTDDNGLLIHKSEIWFLLEYLKWNPNRIISVDIRADVVKRNKENVDPRCKGIQNVQVLGLVPFVMEKIEQGINISAVLADFMGTVAKQGKWAIRLADVLAEQEKKCGLFFNWNTNQRCDSKGHTGKIDAYDEMMDKNSTWDFGIYGERSIKQSMRGVWNHFGLNVGDDNNLRYTGVKGCPMQNVWFFKEAGVTRKLEAKEVKEEKKEVVLFAGDKAYKNTAYYKRMNFAEKVAYTCKLRNKRKKEKDIAEMEKVFGNKGKVLTIKRMGKPRKYSDQLLKNIEKRVKKGEKLKQVCWEMNLPYISIYTASRREGLQTYNM